VGRGTGRQKKRLRSEGGSFHGETGAKQIENAITRASEKGQGGGLTKKTWSRRERGNGIQTEMEANIRRAGGKLPVPGDKATLKNGEGEELTGIRLKKVVNVVKTKTLSTESLGGQNGGGKITRTTHVGEKRHTQKKRGAMRQKRGARGLCVDW